MKQLPSENTTFVIRVVNTFLDSNLSVIFILVSLLIGIAALVLTPREEDPQIVVPMADVFVNVPGATAEEVEQQVASRLEKILWEIDGVEYVYSMSRQDLAIVTVRFFVGESRIDSLVKLYNKISMNIDRVPSNVTGWVIKPVEIDDVPIFFLTLYSKEADDYTLRRVAEEVLYRLQSVTNTARAYIVGGLQRKLHIYIDPEAMAAYKISPQDIANALRGANIENLAGTYEERNYEYLVRAGAFFNSATEIENLIIGVYNNRPLYLKNVSRIVDGPEEVNNYVRIAFGPAAHHKGIHKAEELLKETYPAVTIAFAKRKGTNAVWVTRNLKKKIEELKHSVIPDNIHCVVTRDFGEIANEKVNELVKKLFVALLTVICLVYLVLGWREGLIVVFAVPIAFSLTLLINMLVGYSINRVTLFALILTLGLVCDDPIVDVENIYRHFKLKLRPPKESVLFAVNEVRPPIIVATLAVIIAFLPMSFITGMMGPYMRPMALNVPVSMLMSLLVSFTITPWMCFHLMKKLYYSESPSHHHSETTHSTLYKVYSSIMRPLINNTGLAIVFLGVIVALLVIACLLIVSGMVPVKMLPFDNKNEFQIVVNMPEGTTLETTKSVCDAFIEYLRTVPEVTDVEAYVGTASPMDFNGMVRHYFLRQGSNVADLRINLVHKHIRQQQNHTIVLRLRKDIMQIARQHNANIQIVEVPPGPPVFSTLVAEVYGQPYHTYEQLIESARVVRKRMEQEPYVVDVDDTVEAEQVEWRFVIDKNKALLHGVMPADIVSVLNTALSGLPAGEVRIPTDRSPVPILIRVPRELRSNLDLLRKLSVKSRNGDIIQLTELGEFQQGVLNKTIYHKNLERVVYVYGETAGRSPVSAILSLYRHFKNNPLPEGFKIKWAGEGEWEVTLRVFRDLGIAFLGALIGIYILLVMETHSYLLPLIIMVAIPLTLIGIMPGFYLLNLIGQRTVGDYPNPVFFTATAMIGMIALAGIVVRNSIILIDFIFHRLREGKELQSAIIESGAVRFRPILLTAGAALFGNWVITLDPIFNGLGWAIVFGVFASTVFSLFVVPLLYYLIYRKRIAPAHILAQIQKEQSLPNTSD